MKIEIEPLVTQSLAKQISEQLREAIMSGQLKADDRLPTEEELASRYQVSRPTIREALKRLAAQNMIRSRRGPTGGTFVNRPSLEEASLSLTSSATLLASMNQFSLTEIADARHEMERICCRLAALQPNAELLALMAEELELQGQEGLTDQEFCASDVRFHRALVDGAQNAMLQFLMYAVIEAMQPVTNMVVYRFRDRQNVVQTHQKLYQAIKDANGPAAEQALDELMVYLKARFQAAQDWKAEQQKI
ncbi:transcriptional regulator, GntR family [Oceanospirillum multiglobuliferum]|uniref:GntR family transcriptional regulator n=1 Tax=Oceanospirillum multiglobuliferum TaxID=64969 RepID=A0A1T4Q9R7_9GAMM|nr:GntR family transcriptional regulator [Oceanospirillum multiglobuliferum]OPX56566.1 GntR family transcriptional regulator [Oceanospirillum multiglobuliferum]SKA00397.1 transcriptional regulator, GntR family [Oceanospirillum multiglobuliferum]